MSSKPIYPHVPYFYVIQHVASGKKYAGCRFAKGCHPSEFMTEDGYCTSSKKIKKIIREEGLDAFVVVEIKTMDEVGDVHDYETNFLVENDCAASSEWFNMHNNTAPAVYGTEEFKNIMRKKHGVDHGSHRPETKAKTKKTLLDRYNVEHNSQLPSFKESCQNTCMQIYGYAHPMQSKEYQEQRKQRCLAVHGVGHHSQVEEFKERKRQSMLNTHGVENAMQSAEFRERNIQSNIRTRESKINNEIFKGDFGRFEYLWDTVDEVFLMGVYESLSRNQEGRYTKVAANKKFKVFVDVLRMTLHQIDVTKFSKPLPANFVLKGSSFPE